MKTFAEVQFAAGLVSIEALLRSSSNPAAKMSTPASLISATTALTNGPRD